MGYCTVIGSYGSKLSKENGACPSDAFVQQSKTHKPGEVVGGPTQQGLTQPTLYHIGYYSGNKAWWIQYGGEWLGYVPDRYWTSTGGFSLGRTVRSYGEVVYWDDHCVPMGNGNRGTTANSASFTGMYYETMENGQSVIKRAEASISEDDARFWNAGYKTSYGKGVEGFHYGGPGACAS